MKRPNDLNLPAATGGKILGVMKQNKWYEEEMLNYISSLNIAGMYLDVGAHIGNHSLFFALNTKATHVYAFEPSSGALPILEELVSANGLSNKITIVPNAVSDSTGLVSIDTGGASSKRESAEAIRLDDKIKSPVSLIKMDIEGAELSALKGAHILLKTHKPVLFLEVHSEKLMGEILDFLSPLDYIRTGRVWNASPTYEFVVRDKESS